MNNFLRESENGEALVRYDTRLRRPTVKAKTPNQLLYLEAMDKFDVVFCLGPAGTGKTHLAAGMAAQLLLEDLVSKVKIVRPTVEVGHTMGYLPGDIDAKIHPYLRPVLEELQDFLGVNKLKRMRSGECPIVELSPLQLMRGSNFKDAFVVLDEAQNASFAQMKMFLTRLSYGSKLVINGDPTQSDLPERGQGGLLHYARLYAGLDEVAVVRMTSDDCVRHPLVQKMLDLDDHQ